MNRSNVIAIYNDDGRNHCRLCASEIAFNLERHNDICNLSHPHTCCVYGAGGRSCGTEGFHFDNTKHTIVLSTTFCSLCKGKHDCFYSCQFKVSDLMRNFANEMDKLVNR